LPNVLCIQFKVSWTFLRLYLCFNDVLSWHFSIKRFEHHKEAKTSSKLGTKVQFPLQINMLPYTNRARSQDTRGNFELVRSCTYDLLSVVVHLGSMNTGMAHWAITWRFPKLTCQVTISRTRESGIRYVDQSGYSKV
jgi:hypothetical protein